MESKAERIEKIIDIINSYSGGYSINDIQFCGVAITCRHCSKNFIEESLKLRKELALAIAQELEKEEKG